MTVPRRRAPGLDEGRPRDLGLSMALRRDESRRGGWVDGVKAPNCTIRGSVRGTHVLVAADSGVEEGS